MKQKVEYECRCPHRKTDHCPLGGRCEEGDASIECYGVSCKDLWYRRIKEEKK